MKLARTLGIGSILGRLGAAGSTLLDGLIHYWTMDEASGVRADSVGSADLTDVNTVGSSLRGPKGVAAISSAATTEYLEKTSFPSLGSAWSAAIWVRPAVLTPLESEYPCVLSLQNTNSGGHWASDTVFSLHRVSADGTWTPIAGALNDSFSQPVIPFAAAEWSLIVLTFDYDGDKKLHASVNGGTEVLGAAVTGPQTDAAAKLRICSGSHVVTASTGNVGPVGLWSRVLTEAERIALVNSGNAKKYADLTAAEKVDLVSYWNLDEASGTRADSHGDNDLTDNNTVTSGTNLGAINNRAVMNVAASYGEYLATSSPLTIPAECSISFWAKADNAAVGHTLLYSVTGWTGDVQFEIYAGAGSGVVNALYSVNNVSGYAYAYAPAATSGVWNHYVITRAGDNSDCTIYRNGVAVSTFVPGAGAGVPNGSPVVTKIGTNDGLIVTETTWRTDEFAIWDRVLTTDEIAELYNSGAGKFQPFS